MIFAKLLFFIQSITQSGLGFQQGSALFEGNATGANRQKYVINNQPEGVLHQLQELLAEKLCNDTREMSSSDEDTKLPPSFDFVREEKILVPSEQASEKMNGCSNMGDTGFQSCSTSCNGNYSIKQNESSCSVVSKGDSGSDKKDPGEDGCGTSSSSDKDSANEEDIKRMRSGNKETSPDMHSPQNEQNYEGLVQEFDVNTNSKGKSSKQMKKGSSENTSCVKKTRDEKDFQVKKCTNPDEMMDKQRVVEAETMYISNSTDDGDVKKVRVELEKR